VPVRGVGRVLLLVGFAFAVMAAPVSSVAYTIEASLRALHGHLGLLLGIPLLSHSRSIPDQARANPAGFVARRSGVRRRRIGSVDGVESPAV